MLKNKKEMIVIEITPKEISEYQMMQMISEEFDNMRQDDSVIDVSLDKITISFEEEENG